MSMDNNSETAKTENTETAGTQTDNTSAENTVSAEPTMSAREKRRIRKQKWKEYKKDKKLKRKEMKKQKRQQLKEEYQYAPWLTRFVCVNKKLTAFIVIFAVLAITVGPMLPVWIPEAKDNIQVMLDKDIRTADVDMEKVREASPPDEEGARRIDSLPANSADDTWTFCVYMVGSNLESEHENDLSPYVQFMTSEASSENLSKKQAATTDRIKRYTEEVAANDLDMPGYMYDIEKPVAYSATVTEEVVVAMFEGCASTDIDEVVSADAPSNTTFVFQTGGATRWSNSLVNPNRTQRFLYKDGLFSEVSDMKIQDSCAPETLTDFIKFCDSNYKSDHMALILWDHGSGVEGFGMDDIYNSTLSLEDLRRSLSDAVKENPADPYFDIIGFDACLMATAEAAASFDGYGKYYVASEELEPGDGWDYYTWLGKMAEAPAVSSAKVGQYIADSYMEFYTKQNVRYPHLMQNAVTFSVVDIAKAAEAMNAYEAMNEKLLSHIADDPSCLTKISRAASKSVRYGAAHYRILNLIDLGMYIDNLSDIYPDECAPVRKLLDEAVLYKRSTLHLEGSQGLSVYFPVSVEGFGGVNNCLKYVYGISDRQSTNALYYYKIAGCLNEQLSEHVEKITGKQLRKLNTKIFSDYEKITPVIEQDNKISIDINEELQSSIQEISTIQAYYDKDMQTITYYGSSRLCGFNESGDIEGHMSGRWFAFDDSLLEAELSFTNDGTATYVAKILHNNVPSYMTFTADDAAGNVVINSVAPIPDESKELFDAAMRNTVTLKDGDIIIPILTYENFETGERSEIHGDSVKYRSSSSVALRDLPKGQYLCAVVITDIRGDEYYSPVVECSIKNGEVLSAEINPEFVGSAD